MRKKSVGFYYWMGVVVWDEDWLVIVFFRNKLW